MKDLNILLTNDDGFYSPGLNALKEELQALGTVYTFAPQYEKSATSQALTIAGDIYVRPVDNLNYVVNGFPVDCVNIGLHSLKKEVKFDLVVSGINHGVNMGDDLHYSGTVGAARHAFVHGYPAIAVSCDILQLRGDFKPVAEFLVDFISKNEKLVFQPALLNVNYPVGHGPVKGVKYTKLGKRIYRDSYKRTEASNGAFYLNLGGSILSHEEEGDTDFWAFSNGYVSVTPIQLDATNYKQLEQQRKDQ